MENSDLSQQFEELLVSPVHARPVVAAYGLMNSGKSSLFNMLTDHVEQEFFKTNDIRETAENSTCDFGEFTFLDTPGLDANAQDNLKASQGESSADIVVFVHQPQGELDAAEVGFLGKLASSFGHRAADNILLVLSKIDKASAQEVDEIEGKIRMQCRNNIGFEPTIIRVSSKRYETGMRNQKPALCAQSGVQTLRQKLAVAALSALEARNERQLARVRALLLQTEEAEAVLKSRRTDLRHNLAQEFSSFNAQVANLREFLASSATQFKRI